MAEITISEIVDIIDSSITSINTEAESFIRSRNPFATFPAKESAQSLHRYFVIGVPTTNINNLNNHRLNEPLLCSSQVVVKFLTSIPAQDYAPDVEGQHYDLEQLMAQLVLRSKTNRPFTIVLSGLSRDVALDGKYLISTLTFDLTHQLRIGFATLQN